MKKTIRGEITIAPKKIKRELSLKEKEVAVMVGRGWSNKQIADNLKISARTVETHRAHIIKKLDCGGHGFAVRACIELGQSTEQSRLKNLLLVRFGRVVDYLKDTCHLPNNKLREIEALLTNDIDSKSEVL